MLETWSEALQTAFEDLWLGVLNFVPRLVMALIIFLVGWAIGALLDKVVAQVVSSLKIDAALRRAKLDELLQKAGYNLNSGMFLGGLVKWFVIVAFLIASVDVLGLQGVNDFLVRVVEYLPNVIVAALIILVAAIIAEIVQKVVVGAAQAAAIGNASFAGLGAKWAIWGFAIMAALLQLQIVAPFIQTLFTGIVVAIALGLGLSFGLGGQEAAARAIEKVTTEISNRRHHQG